MSVDIHCLDNLAAGCPDKTAEILDSDDPDVGGVMPLIRQLPVFGSITEKQDLQSDGPVTEIGKGHDNLVADPEQIFDQSVRFKDLLEGLTEDFLLYTSYAAADP